MAHLAVQGGLRARRMQEVRSKDILQIGESGMKLQLFEVWSDPDSRMAWVESYNGTFRLPAKLFDWAEQVEAQALQVVPRLTEVFPCWAVFEEDMDSGEITVEIFPRGYRSPFNR